MRIAQVAPLYESVPPKCYGGTERVVSYLTEALVEAGHDVTLYASGDSKTAAKLRPACYRALRLDKQSVDPFADHMLMAERLLQESSEFDVVHSHIDYLPFSVYRRMKTPSVTTLHGRLDIPNLIGLFREFNEMPVVSISNIQRLPLSWANWQATVYHGLPKDLYQFHEGPGKYLAFLGRVSPEKRLDIAIEISKRVGMPLKVAAKVDKADADYFAAVIQPLLKTAPNVEFIGEIGDADKDDFLGNATALLFTIDWPEPFGLVMIEAMACGTPVIAYPKGSVPEVMEEGESGFVVKDLEGAVAAVRKIANLDRRRCREVFDQRFTAERMARDYVDVYEKVIEGAMSRSGHGKTR